MSDEEDLIFRYTRADALADGVLVDVTATAREAGIRHPTAVTQAVFERCVRVPEGVGGQDEAGRTWDVLWMLRLAVARSSGGELLLYTVLVRNDATGPRPVQLKALCHPGDDAKPVITILMPEED
ncbi:MAG: hypothetical protein C0467_15265 [Planctomycetaceae bacterium]|nr:hypothetical protein [Planctomycetaceae bacterium]